MNRSKKKPTTGKESAYKGLDQNEVYNIPTHLAVSAFQEFLLSEGFGKVDIKADGQIHRFRVEGQRKGSSNGYYGFYGDSFPAGFVGDYKNDRYLTWHYKTEKPLNSAQQAEIKRTFQAAREKRKAEQIKRYEIGRKTADSAWNRGIPATPNHSHLEKKHCKGLAQFIRQDRKGNLLIPLYNKKRLVSIQYINQHGGKFFSKNSQLKGSYFVIGDLKQDFSRIYIAEGVSSGYSVYRLSGYPCFCAMNASNLEAVSVAVRNKWPDKKIILAADNDITDNGKNVGVEYANKAARACGGEVSIPTKLDGSKCDWNDLYVSIMVKLGADHEQ